MDAEERKELVKIGIFCLQELHAATDELGWQWGPYLRSLQEMFKAEAQSIGLDPNNLEGLESQVRRHPDGLSKCDPIKQTVKLSGPR